jgi:hypothetical protein
MKKFFAVCFAVLLATSAFAAPRATITWTDNSDNEDGFRIERRTLAGSFASVGEVSADTLSFVDTSTLQPGATYCWRVVAFNAAGEGASPEACAAVPAAPAAPSGVQVIITLTP